MVEEVSYGDIDIMVQNPTPGFKRDVAEQEDLYGFEDLIKNNQKIKPELKFKEYMKK